MWLLNMAILFEKGKKALNNYECLESTLGMEEGVGEVLVRGGGEA